MTKNRPPGSNWGDYGAGDKLGRLNELTPERVVRAAAEIRTGRSFCLSLPLDLPGGNVVHPSRFPPVRTFVNCGGRLAENYPFSRQREGATGVVNDDIVTLYTQYSTQWDAFGHIGSSFDANGDGEAEIVFYNGQFPAPDVERMAASCVQGRGVMIDLHRRFGNEKTCVDFATLTEIMREQNVTVERGDVLAIHTGFAELLVAMGGNPDKEVVHNSCAGLDGTDPRLLEWIAESGVAILISDNFAVETFPTKDMGPGTPFLPLHEHCLFKLGIHLGEMFYLTELATWLQQNGRNRFFFTGPPLRLRGHVGSPATPVATV